MKFYRSLGFEVTREQTKPYVWGSVSRGGIRIDFTRVKGHDPANGPMCLVMVPEVEGLYASFITGMRRMSGRPPLAGLPRITRLRKGSTRFMAVDPAGNQLLFISRDEPEATYDMDPAAYEAMSPLSKALDTAVWRRDLKGHDDRAAAKVLDVALARKEPGAVLDYARVIAARAELAVALGEIERYHALRVELQQLELRSEDRERYRDELQSADDLAAMLAGTS